MSFKTDQETFWAHDFGNEYIERNKGVSLRASNVSFFSRIFQHTQRISSLIEYGANIGVNLLAIRELLPLTQLAAVEINGKAVEELRKIEGVTAYEASLLDFVPEKTYDFVFTKGVLIHMNPDALNTVYDLLYTSSSRYICIAEYYNPVPVTIPYRGHNDRLFKRDFAGDMLERHKDLQLVDYGFVYRRDPNFPQDDITWFLLEKLK